MADFIANGRSFQQPFRHPTVENIWVPVDATTQLGWGGQDAFIYPVRNRPDRDAEDICNCLLGKWNECCLVMGHDGTKVVAVQGIATEVDGSALFHEERREAIFPNPDLPG